ncbi:uroporphyrinogen-III synthase [Pseudactinotalea suaedae]|uniref:uroporphyrinogen-III synthase n=1 Tax=Pseudactinotalea suaedae TaxID=1524924 RepID=UPI0012E19739|nr:uroporphyrinogen-III synthase [Pseudactinotalea suaedae]
MSVVLVPRGGMWGAAVAAEATEVGLVPWVLPLIEVLPAPSAELSEALARLRAGDYDWLAITSAAAVPALEGVDIPERTQVAAVGRATATALQEAGFTVGLTGSGGAQELLAAWPAPGPGRVLVVQSDLARPLLADGLRAQGWDVDLVVAYRTAPASLSASEEHALRTGKADIALVISGSVARRLAEVGLPDDTRLVAIGAQTAEDARAAGLTISAVAAAPSIAEMLGAARTIASTIDSTGGVV